MTPRQASAARCCARRCTATTGGLCTRTPRPAGGSSAARSSSPTRSTPAPRWSRGAPSRPRRTRSLCRCPRTSPRRAPCPSPSSRPAAGRARHAGHHADRLAVHLGRVGHRRGPHDDLDAQEARAGASGARQGLGLRDQGGGALRRGVRRREPDGVPRRRDRVQQAHLAQAVREFVLPYSEINQRVIALGVLFFIHICGEQNKNLPHWQQVPVPPTPSSASAGRSRWRRPWSCSRSRSSPATWTPRSSRKDARRGAGAGAGVHRDRQVPQGWLRTHGGLRRSPQAPPVNVFQLVKAAREYGRY